MVGYKLSKNNWVTPSFVIFRSVREKLLVTVFPEHPVVVNCTLSELPDIDTDRTDVHRVGWNNELTYQTTVK